MVQKKNFAFFSAKIEIFLSEKSWFSFKFFSLSFFRILAFFLRKLRIKNTLSTNSKKKFKHSLLRTRTGRSKFCDFSSNFSKFSSNIWRKDKISQQQLVENRESELPRAQVKKEEKEIPFPLFSLVFFLYSSAKTQKICHVKLVFLVSLVFYCFLIWKNER